MTLRRGSPFYLLLLIAGAAVLLLYGYWIVWIGSSSPLFAACLAESGRRTGAFCTLALFGEGPRGYLIFLAQWLPLALLMIGLRIAWVRDDRRRRQRRLETRERLSPPPSHMFEAE